MTIGDLIRTPVQFSENIYFHRRMILAMTVREIQNRYIGTLAGMAWSLLNPLMVILVFWFVFSVGFKVQPQGDLPFIVVFLCGLIPWMMFNESVTSSCQAVLSNSYLVTKTVFPTEILPVVNVLASLLTHFIMLGVLAAVLWFHDISFSFFNFQFVYYLTGLFMFSLGLGWIVAAFNVFFRDVGQILGVVLNLWFWLTPIVWMIDMIPAQYHPYLSLNPLKHIVDGYKNSFLFAVPFWNNSLEEVYFWTFTLFVFVLGGLVFRSLKYEFAEVM